MKEHLYHYRAEVVSVYDGDTCTVHIDLGLDVSKRNESVRLSRINAKEVRGEERPEGLVARDWLRQRIEGREIWIQTLKDKKGKYGRYIAEIWIEDEPEVFVNVNDEMVSKGLAVYKEY